MNETSEGVSRERSKVRLEFIELERQKNIESITQEAAKQLLSAPRLGASRQVLSI